MAALALTFTGQVDPTALATFLLVLVTLLTVILGWRSLRQTQSEIALSRSEVEDAHRPVVVPLRDGTIELDFRGMAGKNPALPLLLGAGRLALPVKNVGSGPALGVRAGITPFDEDGQAWDEFDYDGSHVAMGVGDVAIIYVDIPRALTALPNFDVTLRYADVGQKTWVTSASFLSEDRRYLQLEIKPEVTASRRA